MSDAKTTGNDGAGFGDGFSDESFQRILGETQATLRERLDEFGKWSNQARDVLERSPGTILAALTLAGVVTGLILRQRAPRLNRIKVPMRADPLLLFGAGTLAGLLFGPQFLGGHAGLRSVPSEPR